MSLRSRVYRRGGGSRNDCGAGGGAVLPSAAGQSASACSHPDRGGERAARPSGCHRRPSCSIAAPCAVILRSSLRTMRWLPGVESLVFGRPRWARWSNRLTARRHRVAAGGRLLLHDAVRLDGEVATTLQRNAIADGARAWPRSSMSRPTPTRCLAAASPGIGASAWDGMLIVRILGAPGRAPAAVVARIAGSARQGGHCREYGYAEGKRMNLTPREKDKLLISMAAMSRVVAWSVV